MTLSKYGAQRTAVDGITFHSKKEARRFSELKLLERAGEIKQLELQPVFPLYVVAMAPPHTELEDLTFHMCGEYRADFRYIDTRNGEIVTEDVKSAGTRTPLYRLKRKMTEGIYGITIRET